MSFVTPVDGTPAVAEHVAQLTETLSGTRAIPVSVQTLSVATKPVVVSPTAGNTLAWNANGLYVPTPAAGVTLPLSQHLTFSPANTYDVGASGASRPRTVYAGTSVVTPTLSASWITADVNNDALGSLSFTATTANGVIDFTTNGGSRWRFTAAGHFLSAGDNFYDIGEAAANRPKNLYLGTSAVIPLVDTPLISPTGNTLEVRKGASAQSFYKYTSYTNSSNYERLSMTGMNTTGSVYANALVVEQLGTGVVRPLIVGVQGATDLYFRTGGVDRWYITSGNLRCWVDNAYDIGSSSGYSPRHLYFTGNLEMRGSSQIIKGDFTSATQVRFETNQANQSTSFQVQPNGTSRLSSFFCWDANPTTNSVYGGFSADNGVVKLAMGKLGTAPNPNMHITTQAQGPVMYIWDSGRVDILKGPLRVEAGGIVAVYPGLTGSLNYGGISHDSFFQGFGGASFDLGNANTLVNQLKGVKAWGGGATISCTGSTGFVVGGAVITAPATLAMGNGESYIFIAQQGYWWSIASQGVI